MKNRTDHNLVPEGFERDSFTFYVSWHNACSAVKDPAERCLAYDAIINYSLKGEEPEDLEGTFKEEHPFAYMAFIMALPTLYKSRVQSLNSSGKKPSLVGNSNATKNERKTNEKRTNDEPKTKKGKYKGKDKEELNSSNDSLRSKASDQEEAFDFGEYRRRFIEDKEDPSLKDRPEAFSLCLLMDEKRIFDEGDIYSIVSFINSNTKNVDPALVIGKTKDIIQKGNIRSIKSYFDSLKNISFEEKQREKPSGGGYSCQAYEDTKKYLKELDEKNKGAVTKEEFLRFKEQLKEQISI